MSEPLLLKTNKSVKFINNFEKINYNKEKNLKFDRNKFTKFKEMFNSLNLKKSFLCSKKKLYKINKILYIVLDLRSLKTKLIIFDKNKCQFTNTNGLVFKKLNLNSKKNKKSEKVTNLMIKSLINFKKTFTKFGKIIIHIKGLKNYINNLNKFLNLNLNEKNNFIFIHSYTKSRSNKFGFKKIKAIKKRLKKKFIKLR